MGRGAASHSPFKLSLCAEINKNFDVHTQSIIKTEMGYDISKKRNCNFHSFFCNVSQTFRIKSFANSYSSEKQIQTDQEKI